jgi:ferritin-like metal-binding protein YciE
MEQLAQIIPPLRLPAFSDNNAGQSASSTCSLSEISDEQDFQVMTPDPTRQSITDHHGHIKLVYRSSVHCRRANRETTMATSEERLMEWLRDAHAMEQQAETMLSALAKRIENYPEIRARIETHLQETRRQAQRLEACINRRGGDTSTLKDLAGKFVAVGQGLSGLFAGDEIIKGSMAGYSFEHMEIAAYKILIAAAEAVGDAETRAVCQGILREEETMASWLAAGLPALTAKYLAREDLQP